MTAVLDLFSCEGGAAIGYEQAGYEVFGVDMHPKYRKRYPGRGFYAGNALTVLEDLIVGKRIEFDTLRGTVSLGLEDFDLIHASPPCQGYTRGNAGKVTNWPRLIPAVRELLRETNKPYVIENVKDAGPEMINPTGLCGCMFDLSTTDTDGETIHLQRLRLFETNFDLAPPRACDHSKHEWVAGAYGGARRDKYEAKYVRKGGYVPRDKNVVAALLGITHDMTWNGLFESLPPAYTKWVGEALPSRPRPLKVGSIFSGVGGLDLAVEQVFGAEVAWVCESEPAPSSVLSKHWPDVPNYGDVREVNWASLPAVDIITGGSPCQDLSTAGKRVGLAENSRSNLWVKMREAVSIIRPRIVVWENVRGALSARATSESDMEHEGGQVGDNLRALGRVLGDLTDLGYDTRWETIRACEAGAPHQRARVFLVAELADSTSAERRGSQQQGVATTRRTATEPRERNRTSSIGSEGDRPLEDYDWGEFEQAIRIWEKALRPAPEAMVRDELNNPRVSPEFVEWMMGFPKGWVTDSALTLDEKLKALGNSVVPQQAVLGLTRIMAD